MQTIKALLTTLAFTTALAGSVFAADVYGRDSLKDSGVVTERSPWTGPYVGVGAGYRWHNWDSVGVDAVAPIAPSSETDEGTPQTTSNTHNVEVPFEQTVCVAHCGTQWAQHKTVKGTVSVPVTDTSTKVTNTVTNTPGSPGVAAIPAREEDADSWIITARAGHDWQSGRVVFGVFGEVNWLNADTTHFADADFLYGGGARLGYLLSQNLLAYVNGGIELTDYDGLDTKVDPFLGGGLELLFGNGFSVAGEGRWTFADDGDLPAKTSNNDPVTARILLLKKF